MRCVINLFKTYCANKVILSERVWSLFFEISFESEVPHRNRRLCRALYFAVERLTSSSLSQPRLW